MNSKKDEKDMLPFEKDELKILTKKETVSNSNYGWSPDKRPINELLKYGVVVVDKPSGPTSHQVSDYVKRILELNKAGHTGTLDPKVSGVLPVLLGKAVKLAQLMLGMGKEYVCLMHLHKEIPDYKIHQTIQEFIGEISQLPPIKSAVKRQVRKRTIYYLNILEIKGKDVLFRVGVQGGTYIRKLVHDIGQKLGCGAHMAELRRTKAGVFSEETKMVNLYDLEDAYHYYKEKKSESFLRYCVQPAENALKNVKKVWVLDSAVNSLCHGSPLAVPGVHKLNKGIKIGERIALLTAKGEIIGIGIAKMSSEEIIKADNGICVRTDSVIMENGVYPKQV
jgi:H/ACA ribonucleoprotein complex subunit 4